MRKGKFVNSETVYSTEWLERKRARERHDKKYRAAVEFNEALERQKGRIEKTLQNIGAKRRGGVGGGE